jgi:hypothetical protein
MFLAAILGTIVGIFFLAWVISALFMFIAAKISAVEGATFGRAFLAALGCSFVTWLCAAVFSIVPVMGTILGILLGIVLSIFVIMSVFQASFGRGFLVWIFNAIGQVVAVVLAVLTFAGALFGVGSHMARTVTANHAEQSASGTIADARPVAAALEAYATDMNVYPKADSGAELASALVPRYIANIPASLQIRSNTSGYEIRSSDGQLLLSGTGSAPTGR